LGLHDARVCATDISTSALERTRAARYSAREISGLSTARRERYLTRVGDEFEVVPELRSRVDVVPHNLLTDAPPVRTETCPVVLCRNVLIYFGHDDAVHLLERVADWLPPRG